MKKLLTVLAIFMTMICGSVFLVSCSKGYKKMYLEIEYALPTEDGKDVKWEKIEVGSNFDYVLSEDVYSKDDMAHVLFLRINVKGTSKKVDSLYISQSANNAVTAENKTVKPGEAFKVLVHNIGSVRFTVTPSQGGQDKSVDFGVNIYKELTNLSQNVNCVPGVVVGGEIALERLNNLIKYEPAGETNQTGVNFELVAVGALVNNGTDDLLGRKFEVNTDYEPVNENTAIKNSKGDLDISLSNTRGYLALEISRNYALTRANNVVQLKAISKYHNTEKKTIENFIYVYIVENFKDAFLVSYSPNVELENGKIPTNPSKSKPIGNNITIYNSIVDTISGDAQYNVMDLYTYIDESIYSFESKPGMVLNVYVNGTKYNYNDVVDNSIGIQISIIHISDKLGGLKIAVNPNSLSTEKVYNIRLEVDFTAFDFSASDTYPMVNLSKEFTVTVENLASAFQINGRPGYRDNTAEMLSGTERRITAYNSNEVAKLYTAYSFEAIGMPLNIQATPTNAINTKVYVSFYDECVEKDNKLSYGNNLSGEKLQILNTINNSVYLNAEKEYEIDFSNKNKITYLRFNDGIDIGNIKKVYMRCRVVCTPESFGLLTGIREEYIEFVARIDVIGAVDEIYIQKGANDPTGADTLIDEYLATPSESKPYNTAYINFYSISGDVDYSEITIKSKNGNIKFSATEDGATWYNDITADKLANSGVDGGKIKTLFFKVNQACVDSLIVTSPNGKGAEREYKFVNVTSDTNAVKIYDTSPYIKNLGNTNVGINNVTNGANTNVNVTAELEYLALQSGRVVQFKALGDEKSNTIESVEVKSLTPSNAEYMNIVKNGQSLYGTAIPTFSSTAIRVSTTGQYLFDISANSVGFTAILLVKVDFYVSVTDNNQSKIVLQSKYFVYEIAVYTPARDLMVDTDGKDSILYINDNYPDVAMVDFNIQINSATRNLMFSNTELNNRINATYGTAGTSSIYGFAIEPSEYVFEKDDNDNNYFSLIALNEVVAKDKYYLNNSTRKFSVQALQNLADLQRKGIEYIAFDIVICQFGEEVETTRITKIIYLGNYNKADDVVIVSGVEKYNNVYLSLLSGDATTTIEAYASNENDNVTYKDLGYAIYKVDPNTDELMSYAGDNFKVEQDNSLNLFTITASNEGGIYRLVLFAKDSDYDTNTNKYSAQRVVTVTVSDGKTEATAYLINSLKDFTALASKNADTKDKFYRLRQDVDLSTLGYSDDGNPNNDWWDLSRDFEGTLDGAMTIEDPNSGKTIYKLYCLTNLRINHASGLSTTNTCYGLFNNVSGTIKNIVFDNVVIEVDFDQTSNNTLVNLGVITAINNGTIENCSVNIKQSYIKFVKDSSNTTYNIGLIAGLNNKTISYQNSNTGSNYSHIIDVVDGGKLTIKIPAQNSLTDESNIYIGGVAGQNAKDAKINGDYYDDSSKNINELISAVVDIKVNVSYSETETPKEINLNIGGISGLNEGDINNIAVSGMIVANDRVNIGGISGKNNGAIKEVANYGAHLEGNALKPNYKSSVTPSKTLKYHSYDSVNDVYVINQEQNIGGIIGYNTGSVDNVRVLFIHFEDDKIKVAPRSAIITGFGNVGGIIGWANETQLTRGYVENFISDTNENLDYNIIGKVATINDIPNGANVAGLIAKSTSSSATSVPSATLSFVQADFSVVGCTFNEFGAGLEFKYAYFIGDILSDDIDSTTYELTVGQKGEIKDDVLGKAYIVHNIVYTDNNKVVKNLVAYRLDAVKSNIGTEGSAGTYKIKWAISVDEDINNKYPYLVYFVDNLNPNYTLTIRPTDLIVNIDKDLFEEDVIITNGYKVFDNGIYLQYNDINSTITTADDIVATAVVYYYEGDANVHKLVSDDSSKGLIEKTVLPNISAVDSSYSVGIVTGSSIATLTDGGSTITFSGVGRVELKFVSLFDHNITDNVVIFVENPIIHNNAFNITTSAGVEDRKQDGSQFVTRAETNSILTLNLKDVNGQQFDSAKTYMKSNIISAKATTEAGDSNISNIGKYFEINPLTEEIDEDSKKYNLGQIELRASALNSSWSYIEITLNIGVYLNTKQYYMDSALTTSLYTLMNETEIELDSKDITIIVYNKATELTVSSDVKAQAGQNVPIEVKLTTGYVYDDGDDNNDGDKIGSVKFEDCSVVGNSANKLLLDIQGKDKVDLVLITSNKNAEDLFNQAKQNSNDSQFTIWDLFDINSIVWARFDNKLGYNYIINLGLKESYRYLNTEGYAEREWKFNLEIIANSNSELKETIEISFVPQQLINLRLENYSNLISHEGVSTGSTVSEFISSQTESSLIIPGESGLIKIFAEYDYSYFENITISSSRQIIDGKEYFIRYQQMVYNTESGNYESYAGITADGETLTLKKISYKDGSYDGVIFVRTILDKIVGVTKTFDITISADTYDLDGKVSKIERTKTLVSQYKPGVYINVEDVLTAEKEFEENGVKVNKPVYLIENQSSITTIVARVYGYEFSIEPVTFVTDLKGNLLNVNEVAIIQAGIIEKDITGAYLIKYNVAVNTINPFKVVMKMQLIDKGNTLTDESNELIFYPVSYIINDMYLQGEANGNLNISVNSSRDINLIWNTKSTTSTKIKNINTAIGGLGDKFLELFYIEQINSSGLDYKKYFTEYLDAEDTNFRIKKNNDGTYRIESLLNADPMVVHFEIWYGFDLENNTVKFSLIPFSANDNIVCPKLISHEFRLVLTMHTSEKDPEPITSVDKLKSMLEGEHYILMTDLVLENWEPLTTAIGSLDGNGKTITIKSFNIAVSEEVNVGLFAKVSENTILKNVVVNINTLESSNVLYIKDDNIVESTINFGILAGVNNGLIYNCEVISLINSKTLEIVVGNNYNLTFGGLIGVNNGNITNSRVGTEYFEQIFEGDGNPYSLIIPCGRIYFKTKGIVSGFVGVNQSDAIISSSFVANTSVENISSIGNSEANRTAGFVATNSGMIAYSYVKGFEQNILTTKTTTNSLTGGTECVIYASGAGSVAGFAFYNDGTIHDCYTNTICKSDSAGVAGFVYNTTRGSVYQCYSASKVESGNTNTALATELPFVGVGLEKADAQQLLSSKDMVNCYYLNDGTEYDKNYILNSDAVEPKGLSIESFTNNNNLNNFSFITDSTGEQQLNGVWTYSTAVDPNRKTYVLGATALPELTSANNISRSLRIYTNEDKNNDGKNDVAYAKGYNLGNKINPYIIRSVDEYQEVFVNNAPSVGDKNYFVGYVRFIDDIDFKVDEDYIDIETRSNYILGDQNKENKIKPSFTLIDGNGMSISNVIINYSKDEKGSLGLFSEVYNANIKGLTVNYATQTNGEGSEIGSSTASYVGGIAGIAENTYLIDLNLKGNVTLRAHNVIGGVVGKITGISSGLFNITSDLSVQAGNDRDTDNYLGDNSDLNYLSYAGGIAGIIEIGSDTLKDTNYNLNKLIVNSSSVRANRAGGIAGFLGKNVNAKRLTYTISGNSQILGREVAGGIVADNYADIQLSQANGATIDGQYNYDAEFARYIQNQEFIAIDNSSNLYGNLNAITGSKVVGGFVGVNYGGDIKNSLTKANIGHNDDYGMGKVVGGFIGKTYGGNLEFVYAQNYIDLIYNIQTGDGGIIECNSQMVGGIIGNVAYDSNHKGQNNPSESFGMTNVVAANFFDEMQIDEFAIKKEQLNNDSNKDNDIYLNYVVGLVDNGTKLTGTSATSSNPIIYYGVYNADIANENVYQDSKIEAVSNAEYYDMTALYYVGDSNSQMQTEQQDVFNKLFAVWPVEYWEKQYTKFMPNLKMDDATDYIIISEERDVEQMERYPDRNFLLINDVPVSGKNYIVNAEFTGILIATKDPNTDENAKFIITLNADTKNDTGAGFFKQTNGATIANIGFDYKSLSLNGDNYDRVGGVSAQDDANSRFERVTVTQSSTDYAVKSVGNSSVSIIGSIVGDAKLSQIIGCSSSLKYDINTGISQNANSMINIGGLAGYLDGYHLVQDGEIYRPQFDGLISSSSYKGGMKINAVDEAGIRLGGIAGYTNYTHISDSYVMEESNGQQSALKLEISTTNNIGHIGGIIGKQEMSTVAGCYANVKLLDNVVNAGVNPINKILISPTYYVGGISGSIENSLDLASDSIGDSYSKLTSELTKVEQLYIGGIVGQQSNTAKINKVVSELTIDSHKNVAQTPIVDLSNIVVVGGIVAAAEGEPIITPNLEYSTLINNAMSIMYCDMDYAKQLFGGGLIGQATGSYYINNSTAMGYIWANNAANSHIELANKGSTLTVLGGLVGLASEVTGDCLIEDTVIPQSINNSYSALTLSTANVYQSDINKVYSNGVVGYTGLNNKVEINSVVYSSDYTLTLDEYVKYTQTPQNVSAGVLIFNQNTLQNTLLKGNWLYTEDHLPVPADVVGLLKAMGIMDYNTVNDVVIAEFVTDDGKPYNPIIIRGSKTYADIKDDDYNYYLIAENQNVSDKSVAADLNGVVLGNNMQVNAENGMFGIMKKHSAVSNLTFTLTKTISSTGVVATENNGTIFMVGVHYDNISIGENFAGLTYINNGLLSYTYNVGNATTSGVVKTVAGLACTNNINATIENSYFTGSFIRNNNSSGKTVYENVGSALVFTNEGYILDCYSAGMALQVIGEIKDNARHKNVYYDYYANYTLIDKYNELVTKDIIGVSTETLQAYENINDSIQFKGWKVYGMHNYDGINVITTYNYGYPIHDIDQKVYKNATIDNRLFKAKQTGNGKFEKIVTNDYAGGTNVPIMDIDYAYQVTKGKFAQHKDENDNLIAYYDNNSFLISNIGVLSMINKIDDTANKYFELEVNIVFPLLTNEGIKYKQDESNMLTNWPGLGSESSPFVGVFSTSSSDFEQSPDGKIIYTIDTTIFVEDTNNVNNGANEDKKVDFGISSRIVENTKPKSITNLSGTLFGVIEQGAVIAGIELIDSCVSEAPLVKFVGKQSIEEGEEVYKGDTTTIYNIIIGGKISPNTSRVDAIAGLVYQVQENKTLHIHSFNSDIAFLGDNQNTGAQVVKLAGLVYLNQGTINIKNSLLNNEVSLEICKDKQVAGIVYANGTKDNTDATINIVDAMSISLLAPDIGVRSVSGLVDTNYGNIITSDDKDSVITIASVGKTESYIAGIVGNMKNGTLGGFSAVFSSDLKDAYIAPNFGGIVAFLSGGSLGVIFDEESTSAIQDLIDTDKTLSVQLSNASANTYGGVAAVVGYENDASNEASIANVSINALTNKIEVNPNTNSETNSYGMVIGKYGSKDNNTMVLTEINYTLTQSIQFKVINGTNVGGVVGLSYMGGFNFTCQAPSEISVVGTKNVGGLIGQYVGDTSLEVNKDNAWAVNARYASVEFTTPKFEGSGKSSASTENFGGIIGYWNSTATLSCDYFGSETTPIEIKNNNPVLNLQADQQMKGVLSLEKSASYVGYDYVISNVGGVVGKSLAKEISKADNKAQIGYKLNTSQNPHGGQNIIYGTNLGSDFATGSIKDIMQLINVGGVAGFITSENLDIALIECKNSESIYGMYAVGGVVGGSDKNVTISETTEEEEEENNKAKENKEPPVKCSIIGLIDVGGIIGMSKQFTYDGDITKTGKNKIFEFDRIMGVSNVGGIIGGADGLTDIKNLQIGTLDSDLELTVIGNASVGTIIGYSNSTKLNNINIIKATVHGSIFDYKYKTGKNNDEVEVLYFLPTSIGGVVGLIEDAITENTLDQSELTSSSFANITSNVNVKTDNNYKTYVAKSLTYNHYFENDNVGVVQVQMTGNYIANKTKPGSYQADKNVVKYLVGNNGAYGIGRFVKDYAVEGGIGAFAGTLKTKALSTKEGIVYSNPSINNVIIKAGVSVYAPYGINVGGIYGYVNCPPNQLDFPTVEGNTATDPMYVAGRLYVGGYIGKSVGFDSVANNIGGLYINVQQYKADNQGIHILSGNCVGGMIGYVQGNVIGLQLSGSGSSPIKVFNAGDEYIDSNYVGALIGRIDGSMTDCVVDSNFCDSKLTVRNSKGYYQPNYIEGRTIKDIKEITVDGVIQDPTVYNYGGLVGLVDVPEGSKGDSALQIIGEHYYPFTAYMVQTQDIADGKTAYAYNAGSSTPVVTAVSHYINESDIKIAYTSLNGIYDTDNDFNPIYPDANGWAKEYTLFKTFACTDKNSTGTTGDYVKVLYDATFVNEVNTLKEEQTNKPTQNGDIIYTIYQPLGQSARLYCKYGIAILQESLTYSEPELQLNGEAVKLDYSENGGNYFAYEKYYQVTINEGTWKGKSILLDNEDNPSGYLAGYTPIYKDTSNRDAFWHHISSPEELGVDMGNVVRDGNKIQIGNEVDDDAHQSAAHYQFTFGYTYYVATNYLSKNGNSVFIFDIVFGKRGRESVTLTRGNNTEYNAVTEIADFYSASGSIFDVSGTVSLPEVIKVEDAHKTAKAVGKFLWGIAIVAVAIALAPYTGGASTAGVAPALGAGSAGGALVATTAVTTVKVATTAAAKTVAKKLITKMIIRAVMVTVVGVAKVFLQTLGTSAMMNEATFASIKDSSMGLNTSSYSRNIKWENGELMYEPDSYWLHTDSFKINFTNGVKSYTPSNNYEQYLLDNLVNIDEQDIEKSTVTMSLNYFQYSSARSIPDNINDMVTVSVTSLEGGTDENDKNNPVNYIKKMLDGIGVESFEVPRYIVQGDDVYAYIDDSKTEKNIITNNEAPAGKQEWEIVKLSNYTYVYGQNDSKLTTDQLEDLEDVYGIPPTVNSTVNAGITTKNDTNTIKEIDLDDLCWEASIGEKTIEDNRALDFNTTVYYYGTSKHPTEFCIDVEGKQLEDGRVYYKLGNDYINVDNPSDKNPSGAYDDVRVYFSRVVNPINPTQLKINLKVSDVGNYKYSDISGLSSAPRGIYYYTYLGPEKDQCYNLTLEYTLYGSCLINNNSVGSSDAYNTYKHTELKASVDLSGDGETNSYDTEIYLNTDKITVYEVKLDNNYNEDGDITQFFVNPKEISLWELLHDGTYWDYTHSLSNIELRYVEDTYHKDGTTLYVKELNTSIYKDTNTIDGTPIYYTQSVKALINDDNYNNRFANNRYANGYILYTRFRHKDLTTTTITYNTGAITIEEIVDENGDKVKVQKFVEDTYNLSNLWPTGVIYYDSGIIFSESCRVTFNAKNTAIYEDGRPKVRDYGSITAVNPKP